MQTIREFCLLRAESVKGQLNGSIPSTEAGQSADGVALIDASSITISDMGTMSMGGGGFDGRGDFGGPSSQPAEQTVPENPFDTMPELSEDFAPSQMFEGSDMPDMPEMPDMGTMPEIPGGMGGFGGNGEMPDMNTLPNGMESGSGNRDTADAPVMSENILPGRTNTGSAVAVLGSSLAVLVVGLIVAFKFKR